MKEQIGKQALILKCNMRTYEDLLFHIIINDALAQDKMHHS